MPKEDRSARRVTLVTDDERGVSRIVTDELRSRGRPIALVRLGGTVEEIAPGTYRADLSDAATIAKLFEVVRRRQGPMGGILHLLPLRGGSCLEEMDLAAWRERLRNETKSLFLLVQGLIRGLDSTAPEPASVLAATAMGGTFGNGRPLEANGFFPGHGGILGLLKTLVREWPDLRVKAVDLDAADAVEVLAGRILGEISGRKEPLEVGYDGSRRLTLQPKAAPLDPGSEASLSPDESWVILVTGGARGITAEVAIDLAERYRPTLVLVGRSPLPDGPEAEETAALPADRSLKSALIERMRREGEPVTPASVSERFVRICRDREMRSNLSAMRRAGARVQYYPAEVRDERAFGSVIEEIYRSFGRLDGVIHGAGVIEDKLIQDKALDSFDRVFDTKVDSAFILSRKLDAESLRFLVFFSSVSGRYGNRGQADYAAANEVLNKLAVYLDGQWPGRVVSVNWGPWATGGMVSPEVQRQFARQGVRLIPVSVGRRRLNEEIRFGRKGEVEVIIGGAGEPTNGKAARALAGPLIGHLPETARGADDAVAIVRTLDVSDHVYLSDHRIDGQPVLPMAAALEMMAELAAQAWPELEVVSVRDLRLLQGVVLEGASRSIRLSARPQRSPEGELSTATVEISDAASPARLHYRATVEMAPRLPEPPALSLPPMNEPRAFRLPIAEAYREWLFHGPRFQGIRRIERTAADGIEAVLSSSSPAQLLARDPGGRFWIDPVLVDCGLQLLVLWVREQWDMTSLPSRFLAYRRFGTAPAGEVRCQIRIRPDRNSQIVRADLFFFGADGRLFGILEDMEGACSRKLNRVVGTSEAVRYSS
jgi:NAD(P)-dependent dehydrogenase (short-subunit alcohol dehydrogenase family)